MSTPSTPPPESAAQAGEAVEARHEAPAAIPQRDLADAMPHIVWTYDAGGAPTYFNRKWLKYTGLDLAETLRVGAESLIHPDDRDEVLRKFAETNDQGQPLKLTYRIRRASDGAYRWHLARVVPLRTEGGRVVSWVGTAVDVDEERRRSLEQAFLVEASKVLGTSLDVSRTLSDVAKLVVPHLADWCAIDLLKEDGDVDRAAVAHVDPSKVSLAWEIWRRLPPRKDDPGGLYGVIRTGAPDLIEDIPDELLVKSVRDPELLPIFRALGLRSSMCVPLIARGRVLGALTLVSAESGRRYGRSDLTFADELARRIAFAVDNAQLYTVATEARAAAEAMAADVVEQSRKVEEALLAMRAERDRALARIQALEGRKAP